MGTPTWYRRHAPIGSCLLAVLVVAGLGACARPGMAQPFAAGPSTQPVATQPVPSQPVPSQPVATLSPSTITYPTLRAPTDPSKITVEDATFFGWTLLDLDTRQVSGSTNRATARNTIESAIKPWLAADYLRRLTASGKKPSVAVLNEIKLMIIDSNNKIGQEYYLLDGQDDSVQRMITICGLTDVTINPGLWSWTLMTPLDTARYGLCLADGRAAGPAYTTWLLDVMTQVRGDVDDQAEDTQQGGRWGIVDGLPATLAAGLSIKNGWTQYVDGWHVSCLAISQHWVLVVMVHTKTLPEAAEACRSVASQLVVTRG